MGAPDTDGDGLPDDVDPCPMLADLAPGDSCDDGDACTTGDVIGADCACAGTFMDTDADGVCDADDPCPMLADLAPGDACDDGDASTTGDVIGADCVCSGTAPTFTPRADCIQDNQFAFITDTDTGDTGELRYRTSSGEIASGRIVVTMRKDNSGEDGFFGIFGHTVSNVDALVNFRIRNNSIDYRDPNSVSYSGAAVFPSYTAGDFVEFDVSWQAQAGMQPLITVLVNGQQVQAPFTAEAVDTQDPMGLYRVRDFQFAYANNGDVVTDGSGVFVDDIRIYDGTTLVDAIDFESFAVGTVLDNNNGFRSQSSEATVGIEDCTSDVKAEQPNLTFAVAPTVTDVDLRVYSDNLNADGASIYIFNQQGILMMEVQDINTLGGTMNSTVDVSDLVQGMYFIRVVGDNGLSDVKRFIKAN